MCRLLRAQLGAAVYGLFTLGPWLFQTATLPSLRATLQWASPTKKGLMGEECSFDPKAGGEETADRKVEWIWREWAEALTGPLGGCQRGAVLASLGLCNSASFDRHGCFGVGSAAPGSVI